MSVKPVPIVAAEPPNSVIGEVPMAAPPLLNKKLQICGLVCTAPPTVNGRVL